MGQMPLFSSNKERPTTFGHKFGHLSVVFCWTAWWCWSQWIVVDASSVNYARQCQICAETSRQPEPTARLTEETDFLLIMSCIVCF